LLGKPEQPIAPWLGSALLKSSGTLPTELKDHSAVASNIINTIHVAFSIRYRLPSLTETSLLPELTV